MEFMINLKKILNMKIYFLFKRKCCWFQNAGIIFAVLCLGATVACASVEKADNLFNSEFNGLGLKIFSTTNNASLYVGGLLQCSTEDNNHFETIDALMPDLAENSKVLNMGLSCGYTTKRILDMRGKQQFFRAYDFNEDFHDTLHFFGNEALLEKKYDTYYGDMRMAMLIDKHKYSFINVEMNLLGGPGYWEILTDEYLSFFQERKMTDNGIIRFEFKHVNDDFIKIFYQTLSRYFKNLLVRRQGDQEGALWDRVEILATNGVMYKSLREIQSIQDQKWQARITQEKSVAVNTLDKQILREKWMSELKEVKEAAAMVEWLNHQYIKINDDVRISNFYVFPKDVVPGEQMFVSVEVEDYRQKGVDEIVMTFPNEIGQDTIRLNLAEGNEKKGIWKGVWDVHDVIVKKYTSQLHVALLDERRLSEPISWSDAPSPGERCIRIGCSGTSLYDAAGNCRCLFVSASDGDTCNTTCTTHNGCEDDAADLWNDDAACVICNTLTAGGGCVSIAFGFVPGLRNIPGCYKRNGGTNIDCSSSHIAFKPICACAEGSIAAGKVLIVH